MIYVSPIELHEIWPTIRPGLEIVIKKSKADWIPEDVYSALQNGTSTLHLAYGEDEYEGFVVLTPTKDYTGPTLYIWCAYSPTNTNVVGRHYPDIEKMAQDMFAKKVRFASTRKGWSKMFKPVTTIYERKV